MFVRVGESLPYKDRQHMNKASSYASEDFAKALNTARTLVVVLDWILTACIGR